MTDSAGRSPRGRAKPKSDVVENFHVPEKRIILKNKSDAPFTQRKLFGIDVAKINLTAVNRIKPGHSAQQSGFAGSRRPQQSHQFTSADIQRNIAQGRNLAKAAFEIFDRDGYRHADSSKTFAVTKLVSVKPFEQRFYDEGEKGKCRQKAGHGKSRLELGVIILALNLQRHGFRKPAHIARQRLAPSSVAASSMSCCTFARTGCTVRTKKGKPTNTKARIMPSGVKAILNPNVAATEPIHPVGL